MEKRECFYCAQDKEMQSLMIEIAKLSTSTLYLNRDQTHKGRCIIAFNRHVKELYHLSEDQRRQFMEDVAEAAQIINTTFKPDKINYAIYGDLVSHLHFHLVPKYKGASEWGEAFINSPASKRVLTDIEYERILIDIKANFQKNKDVNN
ncbi:HIT family protein [Priestia megaterium]